MEAPIRVRAVTAMVVVLVAGCSGSPPAAGDGADLSPAGDGALSAADGDGGSTPDGDTSPDAAPLPPPPDADFFVSPIGNDAWTGTLPTPNAAGTDGPFLTLGKAQAAVRAVDRSGRSRPIVVVLRGGTYFQTAAWTLAAIDSGSAAVPIVYEAYPGETPVVSGGQKISAWTHGAGSVWTAPVAAGSAFSQLWVNGARRFRPRANAGGYLHVGTPSTTTTFHYQNSGELSATWQNLDDVELVVFEAWTVSRQRLVSVDTATQTATTTAFTSNSNTHGFIADHRYLVDNVREALGPGQFYLDRPTNVLTYDALAGEDPTANAEVIVPVLSRVLVASDIGYTTFKGVTFSHTSWSVPAKGYAATQGLWDIPAAVSVSRTTHVTFDGCTISHVGNWGIEFVGNGAWSPSAADPHNNAFINGQISDTGAGGMRVGAEPSAGETETSCAQGMYVGNNLIVGGGRFMPSGIALIIGESHDDLIEHNEITDHYQSAISIGFSFAKGTSGGTATYPASLAHDDIVQYNDIHHIGRGATSDMGGIYMLTSSTTGNHVHHNKLHDIVHDPGTGGYGGHGIYFDQGTSNVLAENNQVYRVTGSGFMQNYGRANLVRNNVFYKPRASAFQHTFWEASVLWATFKSNIVYYDAGVITNGSWDCPTSGSDCRGMVDLLDNLYFDVGGAISFKTTQPSATYTLAAWQANESEDLGSISADPKLVDPSTDDFRLAAGSPANSVGFVDFDVSQAGRTPPLAPMPTIPAAVPLQEPAAPATYY